MIHIDLPWWAWLICAAPVWFVGCMIYDDRSKGLKFIAWIFIIAALLGAATGVIDLLFMLFSVVRPRA